MSAPGALPGGLWVRFVFGPFSSVGEAPKGLPTSAITWYTDHAYHLEEVAAVPAEGVVDCSGAPLAPPDPMIVALGDRDTGYLTHREIDAALALFPPDARAHWVATDSAEARSLGDASGVWLLPGTPYRDAEAAFAAIRHCLAPGCPFLGTCGGFQHALVELARSRAGVSRRGHEESDPDAADPVVSRLACSLIGEVRLVTPIAGTRFASICGSEPFEGFHYCSFGLDPAYVEPLERAGCRRRRHRTGCRSGGDRAARASVLPRDGVPASGGRRREWPARAAARGVHCGEHRGLTRTAARAAAPSAGRGSR